MFDEPTAHNALMSVLYQQGKWGASTRYLQSMLKMRTGIEMAKSRVDSYMNHLRGQGVTTITDHGNWRVIKWHRPERVTGLRVLPTRQVQPTDYELQLFLDDISNNSA